MHSVVRGRGLVNDRARRPHLLLLVGFMFCVLQRSNTLQISRKHLFAGGFFKLLNRLGRSTL
jgi:hypothetical protein